MATSDTPQAPRLPPIASIEVLGAPAQAAGATPFNSYMLPDFGTLPEIAPSSEIAVPGDAPSAQTQSRHMSDMLLFAVPEISPSSEIAVTGDAPSAQTQSLDMSYMLLFAVMGLGLVYAAHWMVFKIIQYGKNAYSVMRADPFELDAISALDDDQLISLFECHLKLSSENALAAFLVLHSEAHASEEARFYSTEDKRQLFLQAIRKFALDSINDTHTRDQPFIHSFEVLISKIAAILGR